MEKLVSINITTFNRASLLNRCLKSVLKQSYKNIEIIIVDDCSIDETELVIKKYIDSDKRIKYIKHDVNRGNAFARNTAMNNSNGHYVAFLDDDDEWIDVDKIKKQIEVFENDLTEKIAICSTSVRLYCNNNNYTDKIIKKPAKLVEHILSRNGIIYSPTVMTKLSIMKEVSGFDVKLPRGIDSDFYRMCIVKKGYDVYIMNDITTAVHEYGDDRITPQNNIKSMLKTIYANLYLLKKYYFYFMIYPKALFKRVKTIVLAFLRLCKLLLTKTCKRLFYV